MSKYRKKETYISANVCNEFCEIVRKAIPDCVKVQMRKWYGWVTIKCFPVEIDHDLSYVNIGEHGSREEINIMKLNNDSYEYACIQAEELLEMLEE